MTLLQPRALWHITPILLITLLSACGGGSSSEEPASSNVDEVTLSDVLSKPLGALSTCSTLSLSAQSGVTGDLITLSGIPSDMGEPGFRVIDQSNSEPVISALFLNEKNEAGEYTFNVPIHPNFNAEGGEVLLELGDGTKSCDALAFTILPLPAAPADYAKTVQSDLEQVVDNTLVSFGYDPQVLLNADPETLSQFDQAFWMVKQFTSADREGSLAQLAEISAQSDDLFLERMLMASGISTELQNALTGLQSLPIYPSIDTTLIPSTPVVAPRYKASFASVANKRAGKCPPYTFKSAPLPINSTAELATHMKAAQQGLFFTGSISGRILGSVGLGTTAGGVTSSANLSGIGTASGYAGVLVYVAKTLNEARQALEPNTIDSFDVKAETNWIEDRPLSAPLKWHSSTVYASGKTFNLDKVILEGLVTAVGMVPGPVGLAVGAAGVISPGEIDAQLNKLAKDSCFQIAAAKYGPFDVDQQPWTTVEQEGTTIQRVNHNFYYGVDIGNSDLIVKLNNTEFGINDKFLKRFTIKVKELEVSFNKNMFNVGKPGDEVLIRATTQGAYDNSADFDKVEILGSSGATVVSEQANGIFYDATIKTPTDRNQYPLYVRFTALNTVLPSGVSTPYRQGIAQIVTQGDVSISPNSACLTPNSTLELTADLQGFQTNNEAVSWQADAGSFSSALANKVTYTAPAIEGNYTVTVTVDADTSITDDVTFTVANSCMKKLWVPSVSNAVPGNGSYSDGGICPNGELLSDQEQNLLSPTIVALPQIPADSLLWFSKTEKFTASLAHNSTRFNSDDSNTSCSSVLLSSQNSSSVEYSGLIDGTLKVQFDASLAGQCKNQIASNSVECAESSTDVAIEGRYLFDLQARSQYRLSGEMSCNNLVGNFTIPRIRVLVLRYVDGTTLYEGEIVGAALDMGIEDANGDFLSPQIGSVACTSATQVIPINIEFTLDSPINGGTDLMAVEVLGGIFATVDGRIKTNFGIPTFPFSAPQAGDHSTTGTISLEVKLEKF